VVSNAFLGFENWFESGISEQFKYSEMPVLMMVSQCFLVVDGEKDVIV